MIPKVGGAEFYNVAAAAIPFKVKQEFAAKEKTKETKKSTLNPAAKTANKTAV